MFSQLNARLHISGMTKTTPFPVDYHSSGKSRSDINNNPLSSTTSSAASAKNEAKRGKKRAPFYSQSIFSSSSSVGGLSGTSGYWGDQSADHSVAALSLPVSNDMLASHVGRKEVAVTIAPSASGSSEPENYKRLKTNNNTAEMTYMASNAKQDLERGGLLCPKIQVHRPRIFPPRSGVDMSSVSLLFSDVSNSPILANTSLFEENNKRYLACPFQLMAMVQATSCHYRPSWNEPLPAAFIEVADKLQAMEKEQQHRQQSEKEASSDSDISISSFTDSDTDVDAGQNTSSRNPALPVATPKSALVPIGEALNISRHPRILTLAKAPFNVVQVNAAFHRLMGSTSTADFLGKPLRELTVDGTLIAALEESLASLQTVAVPGHQSFQNTKDQQHTVSVSPVGAPGQDVQITHFSIMLRWSETSESSTSSSNAASSLNRNRAPADTTTRNTNNAPINVMG